MANHVGLTHAGVNGGLLPASSAFLCVGEVIPPTPKFSLTGIKTLFWADIVSICGYVYSPAEVTPYNLNGAIAYPSTKYYVSKGTSTLILDASFSLVGYVSMIPYRAVMAVIATKKSMGDIRLSIEGYLKYGYKTSYLISGTKTLLAGAQFISMAIIQRTLNRRYAVCGDESGIVMRKVAMFGSLVANYKTTFNLTGCVAKGLSMAIQVLSWVSRRDSIVYKVKSSLNSESMSEGFAVKGMVSTVAYIASVPKKFQDFVTNKRWFR